MHCGKGTTGHQRKDGLAMPSTCKWHEGSCFYHDAQHKWSSSAYYRSKLHQVASPELQQLKSLLMRDSSRFGGVGEFEDGYRKALRASVENSLQICSLQCLCHRCHGNRHRSRTQWSSFLLNFLHSYMLWGLFNLSWFGVFPTLTII